MCECFDQEQAYLVGEWKRGVGACRGGDRSVGVVGWWVRANDVYEFGCWSAAEREDEHPELEGDVGELVDAVEGVLVFMERFLVENGDGGAGSHGDSGESETVGGEFGSDGE